MEEIMKAIDWATENGRGTLSTILAGEKQTVNKINSVSFVLFFKPCIEMINQEW